MRGDPIFVGSGLDWKTMAFSPSDMEFHRTKRPRAGSGVGVWCARCCWGSREMRPMPLPRGGFGAFYRLTVLLGHGVAAALGGLAGRIHV